MPHASPAPHLTRARTVRIGLSRVLSRVDYWTLQPRCGAWHQRWSPADVPTRDHRLAARSKNYRYSTNLQVAIDTSTRLVIAVGDPQPGNRNDTIVYRTSGIAEKLHGRPVMADGGYRGNPEVIMSYRKPTDGSQLPGWKEGLNVQHHTVRAGVEHALARMKCFKVLRDYRRAAHTLTDAASGIANLHNVILAG